MRRTVFALALLVTACQPEDPSAIIVGRIWTGNPDQPMAEAILVNGDSIVAVGDSADLLSRAGPGTEVIRGAMVVPGFQDDHTHFFWGGFQLTQVELKDASTPAEFVRRIGEFAKTLPEGEWILGGTWDHEAWPGAPLPTREWIDSVTPNHPVYVGRYDGHSSFANSLAMRLAGVDRNTPDVEGGEIVRDASGEPTGVFKDAAEGLMTRVIPVPTPERLDSALAGALRYSASVGVTGVSHVSASWEEVASWRRLQAAGLLTLRVAIYPGIDQWRSVAESLRVNGPGDHWIQVAGVKGMVDGSLGSTTAWFFEPYLDAPHTTGLLVTQLDSLRTWIGQADSAGLQLVVHAIGTRANDWLLSVFDSVARANGPWAGRDLAHTAGPEQRARVEHAQHLRLEDIPRFVALGVQPSMQPYHAIDDGRWAAKRIGPDQIRYTYAFRSLLDAGARLAFGSDWTVAPINPLEGIYAALSRATLDGLNPDGWVPEEKITLDEALRAYTSANSWGTYRDGYTGMLKPGYQADLVVLDRDLAATAPEQIRDAAVTLTMVGGKVVFRR